MDNTDYCMYLSLSFSDLHYSASDHTRKVWYQPDIVLQNARFSMSESSMNLNNCGIKNSQQPAIIHSRQVFFLGVSIPRHRLDFRIISDIIITAQYVKFY